MMWWMKVPLYVATNMVSRVASIKRDSLFVPTAEAYARAAIREIGYKPRCTPYWAHSIQWCFASLIPDPLLDTWRLSIGMRRRNQKEDWIIYSKIKITKGKLCYISLIFSMIFRGFLNLIYEFLFIFYPHIYTSLWFCSF